MIVRYFAGAADLAGTDEELISLSSDLSIAEFWKLLSQKHPELAPHISSMAMAINDELHSKQTHLRDDDVVDVMPPVAGGCSRVFVELREEPISSQACIDHVSHSSAGGIATFIGVVRDHADGKSVSRLDYSIHPTLALKEMRRIADQVAAQNNQLRIAVQHRYGSLSVGDLAVVVAVSSPHRAEAFSACRSTIDAIKDSVPIWKKEWDADGNPSWVNLETK